jgi:hypothetical protein
MRNLIKCGTPVVAINGNVQGVITAIYIRFNSVAYEVSYFNNGEYKQVCLNECEFTITDGKKQVIGFKN